MIRYRLISKEIENKNSYMSKYAIFGEICKKIKLREGLTNNLISGLSSPWDQYC